MRVLTWNVWWRFGPWEERRKAILTVLRDLQPDVIGLQEVWARGGENLAEWLASSLDMHWTWAASRAPERWQRRLGDWAVDIGNAVLSRWPIAEHGRMELPAREDDDDGRLALYARIDAPTHQVPFFTTHLTSAIDASAIRCQQVKALAEFVTAHSRGTDFPPVVTADFNAFPDSDEVRQFGGYKTAPAVPGQVFLDAWEYADPAQPSATWNAANPFVAAGFETQRPRRLHPHRPTRPSRSWLCQVRPSRRRRARRRRVAVRPRCRPRRPTSTLGTAPLP